MFGIGKRYKIVWKDKDYTKISRGKIVEEDEYLIKIHDEKLDADQIIGKSFIISGTNIEGEEDIFHRGVG